MFLGNENNNLGVLVGDLCYEWRLFIGQKATRYPKLLFLLIIYK